MKKTLYDWCKENNKDYLLKEWDFEKNNAIGLFIDKISYGSGKIANWTCKNNHSYQKRIDARTSNNSQCPYCESRIKKLLVGVNDLATTNPKLLKEWDFEKNQDLDPKSIMNTSTLKVWWKCKTCHNCWATTIRQRTKVNQGCPYCAHLKPIIGKTDFKTLYPELLDEWDYNKNEKQPEEFTAYSGIKVWWKCKYCGHEWLSSIRNRTSGKHNCPSCTMKTTSFGEQALYYYVKKIFPDAINRYHKYGIELDIYIPSKNIGIEFDGLYWHNNLASLKREKHKFEVCKMNNIKLIRVKDSKANNEDITCDKVFAIDNLKDIKQLENIIRLLMQELDPSSNLWTRQNPLQVWSSIDAEIMPKLDRFKILEDKYKRTEDNSFVKQFPNLLKDWHYEKNQSFNPNAFTKSSTIKVWWKCHVCNQEWQAKIVDIASGHSKCPVCSNKLLREGFNDFATLYPSMLEEWDYNRNTLQPNKILKKHHTKVYWKCKKCGFEWIASLGDRTRKDKPSGCPQCRINNASLAKHLKALKRGCIAQTHPEILNEWNYEKNDIKPTEISKGSSKRVWWLCKKCGYEWQSSPNNRLRKNSKCPNCKYK